MEGTVIAQQFDHLSRALTVVGDLPQGWDWIMMVEKENGKWLDCLPMEPVEGGIGVPLTAEQLAVSGTYSLQLKGKKGEQVRHTNVVEVYVSRSVSGDMRWPEIPSRFSDMERKIEDASMAVKGYALHPPVLAENGNWQLWSGEAYEDTGYSPIESLMAALPSAEEVSV